MPKFTFVEEKAKAPDIAWSEKRLLIALASTTSPDISLRHYGTFTGFKNIPGISVLKLPSNYQLIN